MAGKATYAVGLLALPIAFPILFILMIGGQASSSTAATCGEEGVSSGPSSDPDLDAEHMRVAQQIVAAVRAFPATADKPHAAVIALATARQESGIRNLDYGDRDSVGLFQQRPSQGWGSEKQLMDPYYATTKFYNALERVKNWESRDITKVAQAVQRSAYPGAYKEHEPDARVLASALSGQTGRSFTCLVQGEAAGDADQLADSLRTTFRSKASVQDKVVTMNAASDRLAWAYAQYAVANAGRHGVVSVAVHDRVWTTDQYTLPTWTKADDVGKTVRITVR
jgi:hypothetical protein